MRFFKAQWYNCRAIPELHRSSSRSASSAASAAPRLSWGRGSVQKLSGMLPLPLRIMPARSRCIMRAVSASPVRRRGMIFAIGRPLSVIRISSPDLTFARYSLVEAFSSETAAVCIRLSPYDQYGHIAMICQSGSVGHGPIIRLSSRPTPPPETPVNNAHNYRPIS